MMATSSVGDASLGSRLFSTRASGAVFLIRLLVGAVFLSEGIQTFLMPETRGVGRSPRSASPRRS